MRYLRRKAEIYREEIYREEIRREILAARAPESRSARFLAFLNTSLGIWLLSSIMVSFITWAYSEHQAKIAIEARNASVANRLDLELANKINDFRQRVNSAKKKFDLAIAIEQLDTFAPLFPEFKKRTFFSLLWELNSVVSKNERSDLQGTIKAWKELQQMETALKADGQNTDIATVQAKLREYFLNGVFNKRGWQDGV